MKTSTILLRALVCAASLSFGLTGCASVSKPAADQLSDASLSGDAAIENRVLNRLWEDPVTSHLNLSIRSEDGIVTITGRIDNAAAKARAISIVRSTAGVRGVIDRIFQY